MFIASLNISSFPLFLEENFHRLKVAILFVIASILAVLLQRGSMELLRPFL